ncbi:MAG: RNA polymerase sigma-70 factor [Candidatus Cryptobacteroides sp.]
MNLREKEKHFRALYQQYYAPFCLFARHFVNDAAICEDIVSEVFVNMWSRIDSIDIMAVTTPAYIKMCVRNSCLNYLKHNNYKQEYEQEKQFTDILYEENPDKVYSLDELYHMLYEALEKLPESHRQVFIKTFVEGKKREEIAKEMNLSIKSVGRYKQKTIDLLRLELKDYLPVILMLLGL